MKRLIAFLAALTLFASQASAGWLMNSFSMGPTRALCTFAAAGTPKNLPADPATWSAQNIGSASSDRYVVAVFIGGDDFGIEGFADMDLATVTIGGAATTHVITAEDGFSSGNPGVAVSIFISSAPITTGTTADVVLTGWTEGETDDLNVITYAVTGIASPTATDTVDAAGTMSTTLLAIPANGCAIGGAVAATEAAQTWAGLTEDYDADIGEVQVTTASKSVTAAEPSPTISATGGGTDDMALAAWGP